MDPTSTARTGGVTRERAVEVAGRRFRCGGYGAMSLRGVAEDLGVTAPALYRHFADKSDLVAAVLEHGFEELQAGFSRALQEPTPRARLRATGEAFLHFALEEPRVYQTLTYPADEPEVREIVRRLHGPARAAYQFLVDRVRECMDGGVLRKDDPKAVALAFWSQSHGLIAMYLSGHLELEPEAFRRLYWENAARFVRSFMREGLA